MDICGYEILPFHLDIDDCPGNSCNAANTDDCVDGVNGYTCQCTSGFDGIHCDNSEYCWDKSKVNSHEMLTHTFNK